MTSVGSYRLKTQLAQFLDRVEGGEVIEVTRHGVVIAKIIPSKPSKQYSKKDAAKMIKSLQPVPLKDTSISALIDHGRKY